MLLQFEDDMHEEDEEEEYDDDDIWKPESLKQTSKEKQSMFELKQKFLIARGHHSVSSPACNKHALAPSTALRTARSATPLVSGRPGVEVSWQSPRSRAARASSPELSE